jgi:hypothetical protein
VEPIPLVAAPHRHEQQRELRGGTFERRGFYEDAFSGEAWLEMQETDLCEKPSTMAIPWYRPYPAFWPKAARLLNPPPTDIARPTTWRT